MNIIFCVCFFFFFFFFFVGVGFFSFFFVCFCLLWNEGVQSQIASTQGSQIKIGYLIDRKAIK